MSKVQKFIFAIVIERLVLHTFGIKDELNLGPGVVLFFNSALF